MRKNTWNYVKRASQAEMAEMVAHLEAENEFQQQEPHGWDENDNDCPICFRLEFHDGWQMQAYTPAGTMMDSSFHESFIRCNDCGKIFTYGPDDDTDQYCPGCDKYLDGGYNYRRRK